MNADRVYQRLARKAWVILITCLLLSGIIFSAPAPVSASPVQQVTAADLAVSVTADQTPVNLLDPIGFTIEVSNVGVGSATEVMLTDTLPIAPGLAWTAGGTNGASCTIASGVLTCGFGELAVGAVKTITLNSPTTTDMLSGKITSYTITNTATAAAGDEVAGPNNSATASIIVQIPFIASSVIPDSSNVVTGNPITYNIGVGNLGDGTAWDLDLEYYLPPNPGLSWSITNMDVPEGVTHDCTFETIGTSLYLLCSFDQLPAQEEIHITVTSPTTDDHCGLSVSSAGTVGISNGGGTKTKPAVINIICPLYAFNFADEGPIIAGDEIGFIIGVGNPYSIPAYDVILTDILPTNAGLDWQFQPELANICSIASGVLTCNLGTLDPHINFSMRIFAATSSAACGPVVNDDSFTSSNRGSGSASTIATILCPNIYTLQWVDDMRPAAGNPINLTVEVGNGGAGTARDILVDYALPANPGLIWSFEPLTLPAGVTGSCAINTSGTTPQLHCSFDQLATNQGLAIQLTSPTTNATCGNSFQIAGTISASNGGEYTSMPATVEVLCPALPISVTADTGPFGPGVHMGFTIEVSNPYPVAVYGVTLTDTPDFDTHREWLIDQQLHPECSLDSGTWICNIGTMAPLTTYSIHVFAAVSRSTCGMVVDNSASVSDSRGKTSSASDSLTVNCPDLVVTNTAASEAVSSGDTVGFDMAVTNNGTGQASNVTLSDTLPIFSGHQWSVGGTNGASCTIASGVLSCSFGDLAAGETRTIHITSPTIYFTCSNSSHATTITNTAAVAAYNELEGESNNSAAAIVRVLCPDFRISVWPDNFTVVAGAPVSLNVDFYNGGLGIARDVLVEATLPTNPGLNWSIAGSNPEGAADNCIFGVDPYNIPELICNFDQLTPDQEIIITLTSPTTYASCGWLYSEGYLSANNGGGAKAKRLAIPVNCPNVTAISTVDQAGFTRDYAWSVEKTVDANYANTVLEPVAFDYTVNVSQTGFTDSAWLVQGKITVANPNPNIAITGATVTDAVDNGGTCSVEGGTNVTIPAGGSVTLDYGCLYAAQPEYNGSNTAVVAWDQNTFPFPPLSSEAAPFEFTTLSTTNQSIDVTDSFNGEVIQLNTGSILASDDPEALTTWSQTYTREAPAPTNACEDYTFTTEMPGTGQSASETVRVCLPSLVTDSALCTFDINTSTPEKDFRLILTPDTSAPNVSKLNASNPGQFYYNIFYANPTSAPVSPAVTLTLPYPFITQGAVPLHAYNGVNVSSQNGQACLSPGAEIMNSITPAFSMADWGPSATFGSTREIQIQLPEIPANGLAYVNLHLDYGLKDSGGYTRGLNDSAVSPAITIPNPQLYAFIDNLGMTHTINSINVFKKNPGIGGQAASGLTMNPTVNTRMDIYDGNKKLLATVYTDEDGWYMWSYKYTGKASTFYVKATAPGYSKTQAVTLKANGFVVVNFLDMP